MKMPSWWSATAPHWASRTVVLVGIAGIGAATLVAVLDGDDGPVPPTPTVGGEPTGAAESAPASEGRCSPSSEADLYAWGPDRPTYTDTSFPPALVINATRDNANIGDERNFVAVREVRGSEGQGPWSDHLEVRPDGEYLVRAYARVDGPQHEVAEDVRVSFNLPTCTGHQVAVTGFLASSDLYPTRVWDSASFWARDNFNLAFVPDSAAYYGNASGPEGFDLPDSVVTADGALLGNDKDGIMEPGYANAVYVTFKVRAQFPSR